MFYLYSVPLTIIWFLYFWLFLIIVWPVMLVCKQRVKKGDWAGADRITRKWVPAWANSLLWLAGVRKTVTGVENIPTDRPCVFVANHQSYYDIPIMLTCLNEPHAIMAKAEIKKIPLVRGWMENLGCLFVDRKDARSAINTMKDAEKLLKMGRSVTIFPEGTRSKNGEIGDFKGGSFRIATRTGVCVVPVRIEGTRDIMENNGFYWMKPGKVTVHILPAVETAGLSKEEQKLLPDKVRDILVADRAKEQEQKNSAKNS